MKSARLAAVAAIVLGLVAPSAHSAPVIVADCQVDGVTAAGATCVTEWELTADQAGSFVSVLYTHANYHGFPSQGAVGNVKLEWFDAADKVIYSAECLGLGGHGDGHPGEFAAPPLCTDTTPADASQPTVGTQKLVITAIDFSNVPAAGTRMHGRLALSPAGDPI